MSKRLISALSAALVATSVYAASAHEHGAAKMNVSVDGKEVVIELETPLDSVLGFERAPNGAKEEQAVKDMAAKLRKADALFAFSPKAECKLVSVELESEVLSAELLGETNDGKRERDDHRHDGDHEEHADHHDGDHDDHEEHADLDAEFNFVCRNPKALSKIDVNLFKAFPKLNEIEAQIVTAKTQNAAELSAKNAAINIAQ
ncbi:MAG: DUF2796 domain-containing protein [Helicobacteraceae bacterium]|jgi:hypothetical protein|nr:DUF2796 domain-containing protein [Helicobacteraceae bacterium]